MSTTAPSAPPQQGTPNLIAHTNPVTRILGVLLVCTPLMITVDWVSATVTLVLVWALAPLLGTGWGQLTRASWPLWAAAPLAGLSMLLYGQPGGREYAHLWLVTISDNSINLAISIALRVVAVGAPIIIAARGIDPTELGDGLAQILKLPSRFVIGAIAGGRLMSLFRRDWDTLERARRSRGLGDRAAISRMAQQTFSLLVLAIRRGTKLATAMEARGFGGSNRRTWARPSRLGWADAWLILGCILVPTLSLGCAVWAGTFRLFGLS